MDEEYVNQLFSSTSEHEFYTRLDGEKNYIMKNQNGKSIVAVTACTAGIAHTYMAAEALVKSW